MVKISGGAPGGWHGGQLPGASAPFLFRFDAQGVAEVDGEIAQYLMSIPGPFALVAEIEDKLSDEDDGESQSNDSTPDEDSTPDNAQSEPPEPSATTQAKPKRTSSRKKSLDE